MTVSDPSPKAPDRRRPSVALTLAAVVVLIVLAALVWLAGSLVHDRVLAGLRQRAEASTALHVAVLRSELDKQRALPLVLADDAELKAALAANDSARFAVLNRKLEMLCGEARAAVVYLLDNHGRAVSASNWRLPTSFVGSEYQFRPYYSEAMNDGAAEYFALGTVSDRPGLFLSRRVEGANGPLGVVVVKVELDALEQAWRQLGDPAFVVDPRGVVLITSAPDWRFRTIAPLDPRTVDALHASRQFGDASFAALPLRRDGGVTRIEGKAGPFLETVTGAPAAGWKMHLLTPIGSADQAAVAARLIAALTAGLMGFVLAWGWRRWRRAALAAAASQANRIELEQRVEARTGELTQANSRLVGEVEERRRAERKLRVLQTELVQANRLASLGQIAAGVAHEINQPVAAIRAYADNAVVLLARGRNDEVRANLGTIADMTERVGTITDELRAFSRKATGEVQPTSVAEAVDGSLLLTTTRVRQSDVTLVREGDSGVARVLAERVRLEQVLVNLLQNAFEAVEGMEGGRVVLSVREEAERVLITVRDNGPGLSPEVEANLFTPFLTTKPKGLGLGLIISRDIMASFGGELTARSAPGEGAAFTVSLRRAPA